VEVGHNEDEASQPKKSESPLQIFLGLGASCTGIVGLLVYKSSQVDWGVGQLVVAGFFFLFALAAYVWLLHEFGVWVRKRRAACREGSAEGPSASRGRSRWRRPASERIMDQSEAKRRWRRRLTIAAVLAAGAALFTVGGVRALIHLHAIPFTARVQSEQCSGGHCSVEVNFTQPNGESYTDFPFDPVSQSRIHLLPSGQQVLTLYWFPSNGDDVETETGFWYAFGDLVGIDLILLGVAIGVLYSGRFIRRQAKQPPEVNFSFPERPPGWG
jgi:hypothetical protein